MKIIILITLAFSVLLVHGQKHTEKITRELTFEKRSASNALLIANISGSIQVEAYDGEKVLVEVNKQISAKTEERLEQGKQKIQLRVIDLADTLILYIDGLCSGFVRKGKKSDSWSKGIPWGYEWNNCNTDDHHRYDHKMDFKVKLPAHVNLYASTVNDGHVEVINVKGVVIANNVNGGIKLTNLVREARAHTVNGNVDIEYASNPKADCRFYTLNGDINAWFQKGLAAHLAFESFNGSFYTNIDKLESLPISVEKKPGKEITKYKVSGNRFKVGSGGALLDFETFNGNVYVKERIN